MPGLGGRQLAAQLRERQLKVPILFVSGYPDRTFGNTVDPRCLLPKPFTPSTLLRKVRELIDGAS
jgi:FixJ family two-component response regulator